MIMSRTLTLVRHGESESNAAKRAAEKGKPFPQESQLMGVHTSERRLTDRGMEQAKQAGEWVRGFLAEQKGITVRGYVSPYVRAAETAGLMRLSIDWRIDPRLSERNWGDVDQMTQAERMRLFRRELDLRRQFALFWAPPGAGSESLMDVFLRLRDLDTTLEKRCSGMNVVLVCHGETMYAERFLREYWLPRDLRAAMESKDKRFDIHNCRIIQYSRFDAEGKEFPYYVRLRFIDPRDPMDPKRNADWMPIVRPVFSDDQLLEYASLHPRFLQAS